MMRAEARLFYALTCATMAGRCLVYLYIRRPLYTSAKRTCPTACVPARWLERCGRRAAFLPLLAVMLVTFAVAALHADLLAARLAAALTHTAFSMGCAYALEWGHGQYPVLWTAWALALLPAEPAAAAARGAAAYLYVCAGLAKLSVPASPSEYLDPRTMRAHMSSDGENPRFDVLCPPLGRLFIRSPMMLRVVVWGTLGLELIGVPATFVLPLHARAVLALLCVAFHVGIALVFSATAGTMFLQLSGVYALGLCGPEVEVGSAGWVLAAVLAAAPAARYALAGDPYVASERWPLTNCALFPWSARQIHFVEAHLGARASTRLVLAARRPGESELIGAAVSARGGPVPPRSAEVMVHNAYGNVWNWTKVRPIACMHE